MVQELCSDGGQDATPEHHGNTLAWARTLARWAQASVRAREGHACTLDVPYGHGPRETLDVFTAPQPQAPVLVFIHGGGWRALDKSDHSFVGPCFTRHGACVVVPNYALAPAATVPEIVLQMVRALAWTFRHIERFGGDPRRITVAGHSAGGHLATMLLNCQWPQVQADLPRQLVRNALSVSGMYDLAPLLEATPLRQVLRLTPGQVAQASPARLPAPRQGTLYAVVGGDESEERLRQAQLIREAWGAARVPVCETVPGLDHFEILDALVDAGHRVHQLALDLLRG